MDGEPEREQRPRDDLWRPPSAIDSGLLSVVGLADQVKVRFSLRVAPGEVVDQGRFGSEDANLPMAGEQSGQRLGGRVVSEQSRWDGLGERIELRVDLG